MAAQENTPLDPASSSAGVPQKTEKTPLWVAKAKSFSDSMIVLMDKASRTMSPENLEEEQAPENIARGPIMMGMWMIVVIFGVFGVWSMLAPIDSAAIAIGKVVLDSNRKTIQHLEGGIVKKIFVKEGQTVRTGEPLVELDETKSKAQLDLFESQYVSASAVEARLLAERDGKDSISFPPQLIELEKKDKNTAASIDSQRRIFEARRNALQGQTKVLNQKIAQTKNEIDALHSQIRSADQQIGFLDDEIKNLQTLVDKGLAPRPRLLALQRQKAEVAGQRGSNMAQVSRAQKAIGESELAIINLENDFTNDVVTKLKETQDQVADLEERLRASADVMNRIVIRSPIAGSVTGLNVHTLGGVVRQGDTLMEIVPSDDELIVEAKISPQDIDVVHDDLEASVRLSAFRSRQVPPVKGRVVNVSADRFDDPRTGEAYYLARVVIDKKQLEMLGDAVTLTPGMPAEVLIKTGQRTFFAYVMSPIRDSFRRAFREQ